MATKEERRKLLGQLLLEKNLVSENYLKEALDVQEMNGKALGDVLVDLEYTTSKLIMEVMSDYLGMEIINLEDVDFMQDVLDKIHIL